MHDNKFESFNRFGNGFYSCIGMPNKFVTSLFYFIDKVYLQSGLDESSFNPLRGK